MTMLSSQLGDNLSYRLLHAKTNEDKLLAILDTRIQFKRSHPFSDRNERIIINHSLLQEGFPSLNIKKI
ncbi:hypothetical protein [Carnobacterium funditum]|uniref:hypothetical protein n=1 Tax=Carnobacterium funditum TaxID=2752 RepID=UPI000B1A4796|nr:hypothetical protein [Carnobacterium funditum]